MNRFLCSSLIAVSLIAVSLILPIHGTAQDESDAELEKQLPRIAGKSPQEALETFRLRDGYRLELVAHEPDVIDPVAISFDENGRLYVVEMRDYPFTSDKNNLTTSELAETQPTGRVRLLEDTDNDGRVDKSTVFLDGVHWPTGIVYADGGVFVSAAPDIIFARDNDGDGVADVREVHYSGFGRRNVQALVNGLRLGLDTRIYGSAGRNGGDVRSLRIEGDPKYSSRSGDFRFRPGEALESVSSAGGQFGMCFDDFGHRFACSNSDHARHVVIGEHYLSRNPWLAATSVSRSIPVDGGAAPVFRTSSAEPWRIVRTRWRAGSKNAKKRFASTELVPIGFFTSATGLLVHGGDAYGDELRGDLLVGDVGGNLVHRKRLTRVGQSFRAERPDRTERDEFLTSSDNWFRPTQLVNAPDGSIYILDMYRETIEHPYSIPERIKRHLALTGGNDRGRIYRLVRDGAPRRKIQKLGSLNTRALAVALDSRNVWTRRTAARLLVERREQDTAVRVRERLAATSSPLAKIHALYVLSAIDALASQDVDQALRDESSEVRRHATRLFEELAMPTEELRRSIVRLESDPSAQVRFQLALTLGSLRSDEAAVALAGIVTQDHADSWTRLAALASSAHHGSKLLAALVERPDFLESPNAERFLERLAEIQGAKPNQESVSSALSAIASIPNDSKSARHARLRAALLRGLGRGLGRRGTSLQALLASSGSASEGSKKSIDAVIRDARRTLGDAKQGLESRRLAARLVAFAPVSEALEALGEALQPDESVELQIAVVQSLSAISSKDVAETLVEAWPRMSPRVRREATEALFRRDERLVVLLDALREGRVSPVDLEPARHKQLRDYPETHIRDRARRELAPPKETPRSEVVARYRKALEIRGDAKRGAIVVEKTCATCHRARGKGHAVGPDLESLSRNSPESLVLQILDPNREVDPKHLAYTAVTRDGRVLTGRIAEETPTSVRLLRGEGASDTILRSELLSLTSTKLSLMPDDLEKTVTIEQLADVLAFIASLAKDAPAEN